MSESVKAQVLEVLYQGIKVKILTDEGLSSVGFIPKRELSWDESVNAAPSVPKIGDVIEARVMHEGKPNIYLSLRQMSQPWIGVDERYYINQIVRGEVVGVRSFSVFVQLEPGIHAVIRPVDLPLLAHQLPKDLLAMGDQVQGMITSVDLAKHEIEMSLTTRLRQLSRMTDDARRSELLGLFSGQTPSRHEVESHLDAPKRAESHATAQKNHWPTIASPRRIMVLDDDKEDCGRVTRFLRQALDIQVDGVLSRSAAIKMCKLTKDYDLIVIDIRLKNARGNQENGNQAARELLDLRPDLAIVFTSSDPFVDRRYTAVYGRHYPFVVKDPSAILECIHDLCTGYWEETHEPDSLMYTGGSTLLQQLGLEAIAHRTLPETLQVMLTRLRLDTQTSHAMVFEADSTSKTVSLVAADPPLPEDVQKVILDGLYYSPVQNVIIDERPIYEPNINQRNYRRFKSLFPVVPLQSFFGLPLTVPDFVTRHALFLFDENRGEIEAENLDKVRLAATFMQVAIERAMLVDYMRRFELRYTLGQLLGSLVHELTNRLDSLGSNIETLPAILERVGATNEPSRRRLELENAQETVSALTQDESQLKELLEAYSRLVSGDFEAVDVGSLLHRVKLQMDTKARDAKVEIHLIIPPDLPLARAIASRLEQVIINLVLNSIQQIEQQNDALAQVVCDQAYDLSLASAGQIILEARHDERICSRSVEIRVVDTGPGIHRHQQRWIFLLDTSKRRRGRGLGLFISRNLTEMMEGRLYLEDSLLFLGSSFVVDLPLATQSGRR